MKSSKIEQLSSLAVIVAIIIICRYLIAFMSKMADVLDVMAKVVNRSDSDASSRKGPDPSKALFNQIKKIHFGKLAQKPPKAPRRTVDEVAKAQGRTVIFFCPDGSIRSMDAEIVGRDGRFFGENKAFYRESIPFSFADEATFNEWLAEAQSNKDKESK